MKILCCLVLFLTLKEALSQTRRNAKVDVKVLIRRSPPPYGGTNKTIAARDIEEEDNPLTDEMKLVFLKNPAVTCNDGSPAGFYLRENNRRRKRWLIFLEGGLFCHDQKSCDRRKMDYPHLTSSVQWPPEKNVTKVVLKAVEYLAGQMYRLTAADWDGRFIPYCSSDLWIGTKPQSHLDDIAFMGSLIIQEVLKDLASLGIKQAKVVMLAGSGAGGSGVLMNIDRVDAILKEMGAEAAQVRGLVDSGWFLDLEPIKPRNCRTYVRCSPLEAIQQGLSLWNAALPQSCRSQFSAPDEWQCYLGNQLYPSLKAPVFVVQYLFDWNQLFAQNVDSLEYGFHTLTEHEVYYMQNVGREFMKTLKQVPGVFAASCLSHGLITRSKWQDLKIEGVSLDNALKCWEKSLGENANVQDCPFHLIEDCRWPHCNPSCPPLYSPVSGLETNIWQFLEKLGLNTNRKTWS